MAGGNEKKIVSDRIESIALDKGVLGNLDLLEITLTPLQKWIVKFFLVEKSPLSIRYVYDSLLLDTYSWFALGGKLSYDTKRKYNLVKRRVLKEEPIQSVNDLNKFDVYRSLPYSRDTSPKLVSSNIDTIQNEMEIFSKAAKGLSKSDKARWVINRIHEAYNELTPPSIKQVTSDLEALKKRGILATMHVQGKKTDTYWIINPTFFMEVKNRLSDINKII